MESLFADPLALVVLFAAAILLLFLLWKVFQLTLKLAAILVLVALIGLVVLGLSDPNERCFVLRLDEVPVYTVVGGV